MITIALPILVMLAVIVLLIIINMILWQKQASIQQRQMDSIQKQLEALGQALQDIKLQHVQPQQEQIGDIGDISVMPEAQEDEAPLELELSETQEVCEIPIQETVSAYTEDSQMEPEERTELKEQTGFSGQYGSAEPDLDKKETLDGSSAAPETTIYNIGKSGKVYTEEELELLIKE